MLKGRWSKNFGRISQRAPRTGSQLVPEVVPGIFTGLR
jgi:hypothetical protein